MFSWITGSRITDVVEELQDHNDVDASYVEPPETPAQVFAVRAIKHAFFGTPRPEEQSTSRHHKLEWVDNLKDDSKASQKATETKEQGSKKLDVSFATLDRSQLQGGKPTGILMTPGTAAKSRGKTVSFGAHVVDNGGKKPVQGKSGLPNGYPGKFPSPWTPKIGGNDSAASRPRTKLTAALYEARDSADKERPKPKLYSKDDTDITLNVMEPRSDSGKYWKEQYDSYSAKSEKEVKKLVVKHHLAKDYAKKKDAEAMELATKLREERRRHKTREQQLEQQIKDYQERLRQSMAENLRVSTEIGSIKHQVTRLESVSNTADNTASNIAPSLPQATLSKSDRDVLEPAERPSILFATSPTRIQTSAPKSPSVSASHSNPNKLHQSRRHSSPNPSHLERSSRTPLREIQTQNKKENLPPPNRSTPQLPPSDPWLLSSPLPTSYDALALPLSTAPRTNAKNPSTTTTSKKPHRSSASATAATPESQNARADTSKPSSALDNADLLAVARPDAAMRQHKPSSAIKSSTSSSRQSSMSADGKSRRDPSAEKRAAARERLKRRKEAEERLSRAY